MVNVKELIRTIQYRNLLFATLKNKDISQRWSQSEKLELARNIRVAWEISMWGTRDNEVLDLDATVMRGYYKDGEQYGIKKRDIDFGSKKIDILANLETVDDIHILRAYLDENRNPQSTLATRYFPLGRGDRPENRYINMEFIGKEIILLRRELRDLSTSNIRRVIVSNSHSPALAFFLLEAGIPVVDVISLPGLFDFAYEKGFFNSRTIVPVTGDDGAGAMGEQVERLAAEKNIPYEHSIHAKKTKTGNETIIDLDPLELKRINGKTAVIPEDILATGGTLKGTVEKLIKANAKEVVILVSYPIFANGALEKFKNDSKVNIITTDGFTPKSDISLASNIYTTSTKSSFSKVLELDRKGINFFMPQGREELRKLGFCLNPWMEV